MQVELRFKMYAQVTAPLGLFSALVCAFAVITNYMYPQQRKFPNAIMVWTCITDVLYGIYIMGKWGPGPMKDYLSQPALDPTVCTLTIYLQWVMQEATSILSLLLAYTLYASIVKRIDLAERRKYYLCRYLAAFWIPTLLVPLACLFEPPFKSDTDICRVHTVPVITFKVINFTLPVCFQVILMAQVLKVIYKVTKVVKNNTTGPPPSNEPLVWICARFLGAQCGQLVVWLPVTLWDLQYMEALPISYPLIVFSAFAPGFLSINGIIVIVANKLLWKSISEKYHTFKGILGSLFLSKALPTSSPVLPSLPFPMHPNLFSPSPPGLPFSHFTTTTTCESSVESSESA